MAEKTARLGYNEGPRSVLVGAKRKQFLLKRGEKSSPLPLDVVAAVMAFPPSTYKPLAFDVSQKDLTAAIAAATKQRSERAKISKPKPEKIKTQKLEGGISPDQLHADAFEHLDTLSTADAAERAKDTKKGGGK